MFLLKPSEQIIKKYVRIKLEEPLINEIEQYCNLGEFKNIDDFLAQAAKYILSKDKAWQNRLQTASEK